MRATAAIPLLAGRAVELHGRRWIDGSVTEPLPVLRALADGATHVLALLTRTVPELRRTAAGTPPWARVLDLLVPGLGALTQDVGRHTPVFAVLNDAAHPARGSTHLLAVTPAQDLRVRGLTVDAALIERATTVGYAAMTAALNRLCGVRWRRFGAGGVGSGRSLRRPYVPTSASSFVACLSGRWAISALVNLSDTRRAPMAISPSRPTPSTVVSRLRAAGCVFAEDEGRLLAAAAHMPADLAALVERRVAGEPLEYVLGWAMFCGLRIVVEPGVFVPRRRTEVLVREAAVLARPGSVVVDLCCGSAAVGVALGATVDGIELHAADVDPAAVRCARRNLPADRVHEGDLDAALPSILLGQVNVLVANAPYVPTAGIATMPPEARDHEHRIALDGGPDGLDVQRRIAAAAPRWLVPGGHLLIETSEREAPSLASVFTAHGFAAHVVRSERLDGTVVIGMLT